jgi:agmatinase
MIMTKLSSLLSLLALSPLLISAHTTHDEETNDAAAAAAEADAWYSKYGQTGDLSFTSFAHLPHIRCLDNPSAELDVAIVGMPFDSAVSFRPGARFGPYGIRSGVFVLGIRIEPGGVFHTDFPPLL